MILNRRFNSRQQILMIPPFLDSDVYGVIVDRIMDDLQNKFNSAAEHIQLIAGQSKQADLLQLYGLYKQATCHGDFATTPKPGFFDFKRKGKYHAWSHVAELEADEAKQRYIKMVQSLSPDYIYDPTVRSTNSMVKCVSRMAPQIDSQDELHQFLARTG